jgi:hypothetical protein
MFGMLQSIDWHGMHVEICYANQSVPTIHSTTHDDST